MISLILTVLNEGDNLHMLMTGICEQSRLPDEFVVVDGGSQDETVAILESYADRLPLRVIIEPGANISQGRNRAIQTAHGDILAITDAGVRMDPHWLERITQPLLDDERVTVVAGFFVADPQTIFEAAMGATVLPLAGEIDPATFLPSSRSVAIRRSALDRAGMYPEWLDYCEDLIFDMRLQATQPPFVFAADAIVHFRPRESLTAFFKQYYRYARGDGKADLWRKRHIIRYVTYLLLIPGIFLAGSLIHPLLWGLYLAGAVVYLYQPYRRLLTVMQTAPQRHALAWLQAILLVPVIRVTGDVAKMIGYPAGWYWRKQHHPPDWRIASDIQ